jgi:uncharacterized protein
MCPLSRAALIVLWLITSLSLCGCSNLIFFPKKELLLSPDTLGLRYEDLSFEGGGGVKLHGWMLNASGRPSGTVMFLHGNAENISTHIASVAWLPAYGYNVFLWDYRGFGRSQGSPDLTKTIDDIECALHFLTQRRDLGEELVVFGQSLGGALAIYAVAQSSFQHRIAALVVEGAFSSYRGIVREKLASSWLSWPLQWPLSFAITDSYSPLEAIDGLDTPVLIVHGEADQIVPARHALKLYGRAKEPKALWLLPGVGHIAAFRENALRLRLIEYLRALEGAKPDPAHSL